MLNISNYKKFPKLCLPLDKDLVITGTSGAGKTQILWAYMLYFVGFNGQHSKNAYRSVHLKSQVVSLLDDRFSGLNDYTSFLNDAKDVKVNFQGSLENYDFKVNLSAGGNLVLSDGESTTNYDDKKIKVAYMKSSYTFPSIVNLPSNYNCLTSQDNSLLYRYFCLSSKSQTEIHNCMESTFNYKITSNKRRNEILVDGIGIPFSSMVAQKILASLILLYLLIETMKDNFAYYLMDDIEVYLDPDTAQLLYNYLLGVCHANNIKLIVTSRSIQPNFGDGVERLDL
jgi:hypothetical protein